MGAPFGLVLSSAGASRLLRRGDPRRILTVGVIWLLVVPQAAGTGSAVLGAA